jgi:hypothetical protein
LRKIDGIGDHIGDVEAERDQPVHAAEAQTRDDGRGDENAGSPMVQTLNAR